ncbi:hypothetical protein [Nonomuraea jabiensis]|jgi:hypothetical protein
MIFPRYMSAARILPVVMEPPGPNPLGPKKKINSDSSSRSNRRRR